MSPEKIATGRECLLLSRHLLAAQSKSYVSKISGQAYLEWLSLIKDDAHFLPQGILLCILTCQGGAKEQKTF